MGSLPPREGRLEVYAQAEIARTYDRRWSQARGRRRDLRKQRALAKALESLEGALGRPLGTILDAPCGTGRFGAFWSARKLPMGGSRAALVLGLDGSLPMLHQAQAKAWNHPLAAGDLARLPLVSGAVDVVVCIRFMHLVRSSAARVEFLREAARVAGGGVIVDYRHGQTPRGVGRRLRGILARWFGQEGPRIWPGRAQALAEVQEAGMGLVGVVPVRRPWWIGDKLLLVARAPSLMAPPHWVQKGASSGRTPTPGPTHRRLPSQIMRHFPLLLILLCCTAWAAAPVSVSQDPKPVEGDVVTILHPSGNKAREGRIVAGRREGLWTGWHENGKRAYVGVFEDYQRVGPWTFWRPNGKKRSEGEFVRGKRTGPWVVFHSSEKKQVEGSWENGLRVGLFLRWDKDGNKSVRHTFEAGVAHGAYVAYHPNGNKSEEGSYSRGRKSGEWSNWHEKGTLERKGGYSNGKESGVWELYAQEGYLLGKGPYVQGIQHGLWTSYYPNGKAAAIGPMINGVQAGEYEEFWPTGARRGKGPIKAGKREGIWVILDRQGNVDPDQSGTYEEGKKVL